MKRLSRFLSYASAFFGALTLLRPSGPLASLRVFKMLAGGMVSFLALAGGAGVLLGLLRRDVRAAAAGAFGAAVAVRHVVRTTAPHAGFAQAFGADWRARIPEHLRARMLPSRYRPLRPGPRHVPWQRDVVIGTHVETGEPLLADLWQPPDDVPRTGLAVVYLHGSAWHYLDKDVGTRPFFRHLAGQGHVVLDVAYTLAPKAQLPAMLADVKRAIAWMKANAATYGVRPEHIVVMGGSAGGHLALLAAYTPDHPALQPADVTGDTSVRAVVSYYGLPDLGAAHDRLYGVDPHHAAGRDRFLVRMPSLALEWLLHQVRVLPEKVEPVEVDDILVSLLGGSPEEVPEMYRLASPVNHVGPHCPPTLLFQGSHDMFGMMPEARHLHRALREAGVPSVYVEFPDTEHAFDLILPRWSPAAQAATYDVERFLALMV
ncbi:MAG: alpha/beta hydrolase [Anaerolineae bacterium]|nr:alpha/beta hydrolase [Anaerolineae bacterium]